MNVYITQTATQLAALGTEVEVFTRATSSDIPPRVEMAPGVTVRSVVAGPFETLDKSELPAQLCSFAAGALGVEARQAEGHYDVVHSHYWLSGQIGGLARRRWRVPLVHTAHTLAKVKNAALAEGDSPEPPIRVRGEERMITDADRLIANTETEAGELIDRYGAHPDLVDTVLPGVDLEHFRPGERSAARAALGVSQQARVIAFVGRIQPLKAPDVLLRAVAELLSRSPEQRDELLVLVVGGPSGNGLEHPDSLHQLAAKLGISDVVRFVPPQRGAALSQVYRAADAVAVPSYNESFGLVALEAQACGTPVVAAAVGGLPIAVADGVSGRLVPGHGAQQWADALAEVVLDDTQQRRLSAGATAHASRFSWERTTRALLDTYAQAKMAYHQSSAREVTA